ncbi:MAG: alpha/beta hydrolase [Alphaproteobacteria bacterium]|nr:alpha/beta hydrolase [Alphaproteobacteria bacterium]
MDDIQTIYDMRFWRTPEGVRRHFMDYRFGQLHYRICQPPKPDKVPLLCFHLSPNSGRVYANFIAEMGKDRIAIAPDTPGFGESSPPYSEPSISDYAAAMGELVDSLGIKQFDVIGYHTGSRTCVEIAQQRPDQVRRVILISAPAYSEEELRIQYQSMGTPAADDTSEDGSHIVKKWKGHWRWKDKKAPPIFVHREVCEALRGGATAWWGHHAAFRFQHSRELPKVEQPVMILCPKDDLWTPTQRARQHLKNGKFVELTEYAHGFLDVHTAHVATIVRDFLDGPADDRPGKTVRKPIPPAPAKQAESIRREFWDGPYGQLHHRRAAPTKPKATPLVMFHMSPNSGRIYEAIIRDMSKDRIALAPDTPGFGESEAPRNPIEIEDFAATMAKFIDAQGLKQVDIMGYHTGSITCIALALLRPDLVRRVVQISSPVFTDEELVQFRAKYAPPAIHDDGSHLAARWVNQFNFYGRNVPREVLARNYAEGLRGGPASWWGHRAAFRYDLRVHLPKVTQPILIINPNDDLVVQSPRGLPLMQNGRMHNFEHHAHGFIDTITDEFAAVLRGFLDAPSVPPPAKR